MITLRSSDGSGAGSDFEDNVATHITKLEANGFELIPGYQLNRSPRYLPEKAGIYAISLRHGDRLLEALGYDAGYGQPWVDRNGFTHVYSGSSGDLRDRVRKHFFADARVSTLRGTLIAAEGLYGAISATGLPLPMAPNVEFALDIWLVTHANVSIAPCANYRSREDEMIASSPSPLNIIGRPASPFAQRLLKMRAEWEAMNDASAIASFVSSRGVGPASCQPSPDKLLI
jgi:hypothetical protein